MSEELDVIQEESVSTGRQKSKYSNNQIVVFKFGDRNLVGKIIDVRPVNKKIAYLILGEDGKEYGHMFADTAYAECIDTNLTKIFYKNYNLDLNAIPEKVEEAAAIKIKTKPTAEIEEIEQEEDDVVLFDFDEAIPSDDED
jgi:hypothetical protein